MHPRGSNTRSCITQAEEACGGRPDPAAWRFSLEDTRSGVRRAFADIEALTSFLRSELAGDGDEPSPPLAHDSGEAV